MNAIIIITFICYLLYKSHIIYYLLKQYRKPEGQPIPSRAPTIEKTRSQEKKPTPQLERKKLEEICQNILYYERYKGDSYELVRNATTEELTEMIERFKDDTGLK